ncbi:DNA-directed RNA polymerase II subunit RPB7 [Pancytospora philotis]|nr:DNA-directed RNA polymerase II subunit RPB7 [Pancytospora philotis]
MFYIKHFVQRLDLSPRYLSSSIQALVQESLIQKVEGKCSPAGYIISVLRIDSISQGKILLGGHISFTLNYQALVLCPQKGEVVDAPIISTSHLGYFAKVGPLSIFLSNYQIPPAIASELGNNTVVRLKIIGMKVDSSKVYAIGTLNDDCLGVVG